MQVNHDHLRVLRDRVDQFDRVKLANLPTPLVELPNFSKALGGPTIYMKRDDLTGGLSFGGNKTRMLEFRLPPAIKQRADVIVSGFAIQSNHSRQIVVAARKLGMDVHLILRKLGNQESVNIQGNLLIDLLAGAHVKIVEATPKEQATLIQNEVEHLRKEGRNPYETGYHDEDLSAISYVSCSLELTKQLQERAMNPDYIYVASEGATQAGLLLFAKYVNSPYKVIGINMVDWVDDTPARISSIANEASKHLEIDCQIKREDVINYDDYVGPTFGAITTDCINAIKLLAETEGILLDPVYTGKGVAGLIDHIKQGKIKKGEKVIYLHTGGVPALFCHPNVFDFDDFISMD